MRLTALILIFATVLSAEPKRVLLFTHSAGYRHDSIGAAHTAFQEIASASNGRLETVWSEDPALITAESLRGFDVLFFFTSGEIPLSDQQRRDLLAFVRDGKGFGGAHSATDTLYSWQEYGELIGAYFDGHPWVTEASVDIEDPDHPATQPFGTSFSITEEFYQFRNFSRDRVRVLMTLDTGTVDMQAPGINRTDGDFVLAWCRNYGQGRVFYTALGHFDDTWKNDRFRASLRDALLWLAGETQADAAPRSAVPAPGAVVNAATFAATPPPAPGSLVSLFGRNLTSGSTMAALQFPLPRKLAGTSVLVDGKPAPLLFASPGQINFQLPWTAADSLMVVRSGVQTAQFQIKTQPLAPGIFVASPEQVRGGDPLTLYATGLGPVDPEVADGVAAPPQSTTRTVPVVWIGGVQARVLYSGLAPGFAGLYQINAVVPSDLNAGPADVRIETSGQPSNTVRVLVERR